MCIAGAVGCLLPLHFQDSYIEETRLSKSLSSIEFTIFSVVCFTLVTPLILDQIIEIIIYASSERNVNSKSYIKMLFVTDIEKMFYIFGVLIVPMITVIPGLDDLAFTYECCVRSQYMLTVGVVIASISRLDKGFWPTMILTISILLLIFGLVGGAFAVNLYENKPVTRICFMLWKYSKFFVLIAAMLLLFICAQHLFKIFRKTKTFLYIIGSREQRKNEVAYSANKNKEDVFILTYIGIIFCTFIFILVVGILMPEVEDLCSFSLILKSLPFACFILFLAVLLMRITKSEMTEAVVSFYTLKFIVYNSVFVVCI